MLRAGEVQAGGGRPQGVGAREVEHAHLGRAQDGEGRRELVPGEVLRGDDEIGAAGQARGRLGGARALAGAGARGEPRRDGGRLRVASRGLDEVQGEAGEQGGARDGGRRGEAREAGVVGRDAGAAGGDAGAGREVEEGEAEDLRRARDGVRGEARGPAVHDAVAVETGRPDLGEAGGRDAHARQRGAAA